MPISASPTTLRVRPFGDVIDVYQCPRCADSVTVNADAQTFSAPPPLECDRCPGNPDMRARRYFSRP